MGADEERGFGLVIRPARLLAVDIDGTMLRSDGSLSSRVLDALARAVDAGIHVVPATGRPMAVATDVVDASGLDDFWIFANGAITRHLGRDELIRAFWMDRVVVVELLDRIRRRIPQAKFAVEFATTMAYEAGFETVVPNRPPVPPTVDLSADLERVSDPIQKLLVFDDSIDLGRLWDEVNAAADGLSVPSYSGLPFVELAPERVTKATALELLASDLGLSVDDVGAVGDNHNDVAMLEWAGTGYAMGNADVAVQASADVVLPSNDDDGLAVLIEAMLDQF